MRGSPRRDSTRRGARRGGSLAHENLFEIKRPYTALVHPHRFIAERLYAALRLISGITAHEVGVARSEPILSGMAKHINPRMPVLTPLAWVATNLTTQTAEYFYRLPPSFDGRSRRASNARCG
jgi:hypothetical protein